VETAAQIRRYVRKGLETVRGINWLAHSVDAEPPSLELGAELERLGGIAERWLHKQRLRLLVEPPPAPLRVAVPRHRFARLLLGALELLVSAEQGAEEVRVGSRELDGRAALDLVVGASASATPPAGPAVDCLQAALAELGGGLRLDEWRLEHKRLILVLPLLNHAPRDDEAGAEEAGK
jgi:hypothetical protein